MCSPKKIHNFLKILCMWDMIECLHFFFQECDVNSNIISFLLEQTRVNFSELIHNIFENFRSKSLKIMYTIFIIFFSILYVSLFIIYLCFLYPS